MRIPQLFAVFSSFLLLTSPINTNFLLKTSSNHKKLSNYVCKITRDITKSKSDTQDVLIGNLGGKVWSSTVNDIAECVGDGGAVVVSDFKEQLSEKTLRKAAVVILTFVRIDLPTIDALVRNNHHGSVWHHKAKFICVIPKSIPKNKLPNILMIFMYYGFLDVTLVQENVAGDVQFNIFPSLLGRINTQLNPVNGSLIFPDKLKSMHRFQYDIVVYEQQSVLEIKNKTVLSPLVYFLRAVESVQSSSYSFIIIDDYRRMKYYWMDRRMHLTLNTAVTLENPEPKLLTYKENGYCALVPLPPKTPIFQSIFIEPFDGLTWLFFAITMACSVAVWSLFRGRGAVDSPWLLAYGMVVMFIGQGVDFSRKNRLVLAILLQLIIVMIWVLCNAYEGVITSFMIQPIQENRLKTFEDLVASDYEIMTDEAFAHRISDSETYKVLKSRLNVSARHLGSTFGTEILRQHYVFMLKCHNAETLIEENLYGVGTKISDYYYLMPQKIVPYLEQLEASYMNPFLERLQYYMDLSFQAGLPYIWDVFVSHLKKNHLNSDEFVYLKLEDLTQVFGILIIGYALSTLVLLIEIFFHDFLKNLKLAYLARKLRNRVHQMAYKKKKQPKHPKYQKGALYYIIHRHKRVKRLRKIKVRRIFIQPRFPDGCSEV